MSNLTKIKQLLLDLFDLFYDSKTLICVNLFLYNLISYSIIKRKYREYCNDI